MQLILKRTNFLLGGIFGELRDTQNNLICVTLEHSYEQQDRSFLPKLAIGEYTCQRGEHQLETGKPFVTFEVQHVPDFMGFRVSGILLHAGNFDNDSKGCILVGRTKKNDNSMITDSRLAFLDLMTLLDDDETFELTVK